MESKIKCDRQFPCSKCAAKGKQCVFNSSRRTSAASLPVVHQRKETLASIYTDTSSESSTSPSTLFVPTPEAATPSYNTPAFQIKEADGLPQTTTDETTSHHDSLGRIDLLSSSVSMPSFSKTDPFVLDTFPSSASAVELYSSNMANASQERASDSDDRLIPINSHLSSAYTNDMFEPFFSSIFSPSPSLPLSEDFSWTGLSSNPSETLSFLPSATITNMPAIEANNGHAFDNGRVRSHFVSSPARLAVSDVRHSSFLDTDPPEQELQHYRG